jgi:hypothetical protein
MNNGGFLSCPHSDDKKLEAQIFARCELFQASHFRVHLFSSTTKLPRYQHIRYGRYYESQFNHNHARLSMKKVLNINDVADYKKNYLEEIKTVFSIKWAKESVLRGGDANFFIY